MKTKSIKIRNLTIGAGAPIAVQSMTKTLTTDVNATIKQIQSLEKCGCEIVRISIPDETSLKAFEKIREKTDIPLVADIHFNYRLALGAIDAGADKIRINPANIGSWSRVVEIINKAKKKKIPIRIGINAGSFKNIKVDIAEETMKMVKKFEEEKFYDLVLAVKSSNVLETINAYRKISKLTNYPLHIGITEAGTEFSGTIKSSVGLGVLLAEGIGDTIRVSLSAEPEREVAVAYEILKSLGLRKHGVEIISCPTCSRTDINIVKIAKEIEKQTQNLNKNIKIAIMGCAVNGPGEASHADIGIAGGKGEALLFKNGKTIKKIAEATIVKSLLEELNNF
jgi:(E)-4-hydroxy-3-methylbut-2-enyl-diphosphate synthase